MFVACGIWCLADVSSVSPSSEQTNTYSGADKVLRSDLDANCFDMRSGLWTFGFGGLLGCFYYVTVEFL